MSDANPPPRTVVDQTAQQSQTAQQGMRWIVSLFVLIGFFGMLAVLLTRDAAAIDKMGNLQNVLYTLLGALAAAFTQVVNYWLGSSKGSADKTQILAAQSANTRAR